MKRHTKWPGPRRRRRPNYAAPAVVMQKPNDTRRRLRPAAGATCLAAAASGLRQLKYNLASGAIESSGSAALDPRAGHDFRVPTAQAGARLSANLAQGGGARDARSVAIHLPNCARLEPGGRAGGPGGVRPKAPLVWGLEIRNQRVVPSKEDLKWAPLGCGYSFRALRTWFITISLGAFLLLRIWHPETRIYATL